MASETGIIDAKKWNRGLESVLSGTEEDEEDENEEEVDRHEEETESTSEPSSSRTTTTTTSSDSDVIDDDDDVIFKSLEDDFNKKLDVNNKPAKKEKKHSSHHHHHHHSHEKNTDREVKRCLDSILDQVVASSNEIGREKKKSTPPNMALKTLDSNNKKNLPNNLNTVFKFTQNALGILKVHILYLLD